MLSREAVRAVVAQRRGVLRRIRRRRLDLLRRLRALVLSRCSSRCRRCRRGRWPLSRWGSWRRRRLRIAVGKPGVYAAMARAGTAFRRRGGEAAVFASSCGIGRRIRRRTIRGRSGCSWRTRFLPWRFRRRGFRRALRVSQPRGDTSMSGACAALGLCGAVGPVLTFRRRVLRRGIRLCSSAGRQAGHGQRKSAGSEPRGQQASHTSSMYQKSPTALVQPVCHGSDVFC
jgi:hypothetical protein